MLVINCPHLLLVKDGESYNGRGSQMVSRLRLNESTTFGGEWSWAESGANASLPNKRTSPKRHKMTVSISVFPEVLDSVWPYSLPIG